MFFGVYACEVCEGQGEVAYQDGKLEFWSCGCEQLIPDEPAVAPF